MDRRALIAIGVVVAAAFGYWFFKNRKSTDNSGAPGTIPPPPPGLSAAEIAGANYTVPPNIGVQPNQPGQTFVNNAQTMPLPYNT